ncbi:PQQ-binding-like beta-propeller repeat protein [Sphingobacteriaceae bacterium WQ 2009]|uniref:PQQ-binding-like beta-propeller repeat protein n=1 Tax=Rhinopithecimicrobium faecis TaxID=2820698 RepID=A0A8T4HB49_9SPHI|nr:PQQ-binding-like beta-propeller repeat protein [Sphingobacteriaceae bacterium WQ 2009]
MKKLLLLSLLFACSNLLKAQSFKFAQVTDTHVGGQTGGEDLLRTIADLNQQTDIDFVIFSGDITEFGSDAELAEAKSIIQQLTKPYYIIPGNHDGNWSENGANTFRKTFGGETFFFRHKGYQFMGTNSGPNMRMSPGQIPRENLVWMDSIFKANPDVETPLIYINHYPQDSSLNNWYEAVDRLKTRNVQLALCGHGHINKLYDWEGIPGVMGRSNLRAKATVGGYNIITITNGTAIFQERKPGVSTTDAWLNVPLYNHQFNKQSATAKRPSFAVNAKYPEVKVNWVFEDAADIGAGMSMYKQLIITANTVGEVFALDRKTGTKVWTYRTGGKVYATPAIAGNTVVVGSSDHYIYALDAATGALKWQYKTKRAVLGTALIHKQLAYVGGSDSIFRALDVQSGKLIWEFKGVKGHVTTLPTYSEGKVIFGSWGNGFYALDAKSGKLVWEWNNGHANRMFSAAAVYPVALNKRIFIVAPDRFMTALSLKDGAVIWREKKDLFRVRESIGSAAKGDLVYAKTMDGQLIGVSTKANNMTIAWQSMLQLPYELTPSAIVATKEKVFVPSHSGLISAVHAKTGNVEWQYKFSNAMINPILIESKNTIIASSMDGKIISLSF